MIQLQALNYILANQDSSFITVNNLTEEFFSDYVEEFKFIKHHIDEYGKVPDSITFVNRFPEFDVIKVTEPTNFLIDSLYDDKNRRYLASVFNQIRTYLNEDKIDEATKLYTAASEKLVTAVHMDSVDLFKDLSRYDAYVERSQDFAKFFVKTGFKELDDILGGWDREEDYVTMVARTNVGKSWILLFTAVEAAKQGLTVGIYSGEMSDRKVGYRVDTILSHISNTALTRGDVSVQPLYKKYLESIGDDIKGTIKVLTPSMIQGAAGVQALRSFIEKDKLDMLCIDQHSLLEDDRRAKDPVTRASNISRDIKNLQVMKKIPIITVSQQNRESLESSNGIAGAQNISQSDRIGQDSTILIFLEQKEGVMTLTLGKSRDSKKDQRLKYAIDFDRGMLRYIAVENDAKQGDECDALRNEFEYVDGSSGDAF